MSTNTRIRWFVVMISFYGLFLTSMYQAIIISALAAGKQSQPINSLEDLVSKHQEKRIMVYQGTAAQDLIQNSIYYPQLQDRLDLEPFVFDPLAIDNIVAKIHQGTHVLIGYDVLDLSNKDVMTNDFICRYPKNDFRTSKPLKELFLSFVYRKGLDHQELLDRSILWLHAFGITQNEGSFMSQAQTRQLKAGIVTPRRNETCEPTFLGNPKQFDKCPGQLNLAPLNLGLFQTLWFLLAAGLSLSVVVLCFEYFVFIKS